VTGWQGVITEKSADIRLKALIEKWAASTKKSALKAAAAAAQRSRSGPCEKLTRFDLIAYDKALDHGIGGALADLEAENIYPSETGLDLLITAAHVCAADTRISQIR
jgi:hypothetical protein